MKLLLDTHIFLWLIMDVSKISPKIMNILEDKDNQLLLSKASLWEIAIKISIKKLELPFQFKNISYELDYMNIDILDIQTEHLIKVSDLPFHHRDPFDRIIISQSQIENISIVTQDKIFTLYDIKYLK